MSVAGQPPASVLSCRCTPQTSSIDAPPANLISLSTFHGDQLSIAKDVQNCSPENQRVHGREENHPESREEWMTNPYGSARTAAPAGTTVVPVGSSTTAGPARR